MSACPEPIPIVPARTANDAASPMPAVLTRAASAASPPRPSPDASPTASRNASTSGCSAIPVATFDIDLDDAVRDEAVDETDPLVGGEFSRLRRRRAVRIAMAAPERAGFRDAKRDLGRTFEARWHRSDSAQVTSTYCIRFAPWVERYYRYQNRTRRHARQGLARRCVVVFPAEFPSHRLNLLSATTPISSAAGMRPSRGNVAARLPPSMRSGKAGRCDRIPAASERRETPRHPPGPPAVCVQT